MHIYTAFLQSQFTFHKYYNYIITILIGETVTGGKVAATLKYGIFTVFHKTLNLCAIAKGAGVSCPIAKGEHSFKLTRKVPNVGVGVL